VKPVSKTSLQKRKYEFPEKTIYENEIVMMLSAVHNGPFKINPVEVEEVKFFEVPEIEEMIKNKEGFTPWFLDEWKNVKKLLGSRL
jgi:isopentenyldiphosphate isomerase